MVCDECAVGSDFELTTNDSSTPDDRIEQHVELIQAGYCTCGHITDTSKTKVIIQIFPSIYSIEHV